MKKYCVYMHTNKVNGKRYIGQTCMSTKQRWGVDGCNYKKSTYFYNAIQKYGWDNFLHEVLFDNLTLDEANAKEIELIEFYQTMNDDFGYNLRSGGSGGEFAERTKKLMSEIRQGEKNCWYGKKHTEETKRRMSISGKGRKFTEEHKRRIAEAHKGKTLTDEHKKKLSEALKGEKSPNFGIERSKETKEKISKAKRGKAILQYDLQGNFIREWEYMLQISKELGYTRSSIWNVCEGKNKQAYGYIWKYKK